MEAERPDEHQGRLIDLGAIGWTQSTLPIFGTSGKSRLSSAGLARGNCCDYVYPTRRQTGLGCRTTDAPRPPGSPANAAGRYLRLGSTTSWNGRSRPSAPFTSSSPTASRRSALPPASMPSGTSANALAWAATTEPATTEAGSRYPRRSPRDGAIRCSPADSLGPGEKVDDCRSARSGDLRNRTPSQLARTSRLRYRMADFGIVRGQTERLELGREAAITEARLSASPYRPCINRSSRLESQ